MLTCSIAFSNETPQSKDEQAAKGGTVNAIVEKMPDLKDLKRVKILDYSKNPAGFYLEYEKTKFICRLRIKGVIKDGSKEHKKLGEINGRKYSQFGEMKLAGGLVKFATKDTIYYESERSRSADYICTVEVMPDGVNRLVILSKADKK